MKRNLLPAMVILILVGTGWLLSGAADGHVGMALHSPALSARDPSVPLPCSTPTFEPPINYGSGPNAYDVAVADFNHDGNPDLAVPNFYAATLSVLLGDGAGGFGAFTSYPSGPSPWMVAVGDFNRDGNLDLVAANWGTIYVSVLLGDGTGSFGPATSFAAGAYPGRVAVTDFNHDSNPDLVVAIYNGGVSVLLGDGTGRFDNRTFYVMGASPQRLTVADFNRDGNPDVAVAPMGSSAVSVRLGDGVGGLGPVASFPLSDITYAVAAGDFNHDGYPDLAVTVAHVGFSLLAVLIGDGRGGFGEPTYFPVEPAAALSVVVNDFNLDGDLDLALVGQGVNDVSVWLGDGVGGFGGERYFYVGTSLRTVATGDFNLDGRPDLVTANDLSNTVSVLLSSCGAGLLTSTPTPNVTATFTRTPSITPSYTNTTCPTPTFTRTYTPTNTPTSPPSNTPSATIPPITNTPASTNTRTPTLTATPCNIPFTDVHPNDYFYLGVRYLYCKGGISGYVGNVFLPYNNTTRGQLTKIVVLAYSFPLYTPPTPTFRDVSTNNPFYVYIETAYHLSLISGYACGNPGEPCPGLYFRPNNLVTRAQLCKIVVLAAGWQLINPIVPTFNDVPSSHAFYTYIETGYCHQMISGYACGGPGEPCPGLYFRPNANGTRGQICKIVYGAILNLSCTPPP